MNNAAYARRAAGVTITVLAAGLLAACSASAPAPVITGEATTLPMGVPYAPAAPIAAAPSYAPSAPIAAVPSYAPPAPIAAAPSYAPSAPIAAVPSYAPPRLAEERPPEPRPPATMGSRGGVWIVVQRGQSVGGLAAKYNVSAHDIIAANHLPRPYSIEVGQRLEIPRSSVRPPPQLAAASPPHWVRRAGERPPPDIIPLDGPPPRPAPQPIAAAADAPAQQATPENAAATPDRGALIWPVRGRIIEGFGATPSGQHNAGINIAAPQGAPVRAVDGGVVAYAGNQLRGYGNLVLIKHPDGLISAYAHCETLLVHRGEQVARGQVIAHVGETGGVDRPQLHFELRQGERALDPLRFLGSLPG
jgi:murein DD-endopeptidase MepM/ murein hydrolase activator NlpD